MTAVAARPLPVDRTLELRVQVAIITACHGPDEDERARALRVGRQAVSDRIWHRAHRLEATR